MISNSTTTNNSADCSYRLDTIAGVKAHIRNVFESMKVCGVNATDVRALIELGIPVINIMMKHTAAGDLEGWCLDWLGDISEDDGNIKL